MLRDYPKRAVTVEVTVQLVLAITTMAIAAFYSTIAEQQFLPEDTTRLPIMMQAMKITGLAFLLAVSASVLRRTMTKPPLALIWAAILVVAAVAWALGCLTFLSSM